MAWLSNERRLQIEAWFTGSVLFGVPIAAVLGVGAHWLGYSIWVAVLPLIPGLLFAVTAFSMLALAAPLPNFIGFAVLLALITGVGWDWQTAMVWMVALAAMRAWGEAAQYLARRLGFRMLD